jgi:hypothetical protein
MVTAKRTVAGLNKSPVIISKEQIDSEKAAIKPQNTG